MYSIKAGIESRPYWCKASSLTTTLVIVLTKAAPALAIKWSGEYFLK